MPFAIPTFDDLLNSILTNYKNQSGSVSAETMLRSACLASAVWGAYNYQEYISRQPFPDTADTDNLNHHGAVQGVARNAGESDADYLSRILDDIQNPSAGGNQYDYRQWAKEIDGVAEAYVFPLAQGDGTVDVVVVADEDTTGEEIPSMSVRDGTVTTVFAYELNDSAANFDTGLAVSAGDIVRNTFEGTEARVVDSPDNSATKLTLDADIFKQLGEHYHVYMHTGTSTAITTDKLVDSAGAFDDATYTVKKGDVVKNLTDGTQALVASVDSATQLTLDTDIFTATGKSYVVESLIARVKEYIDAERPVTSSKVRVLAPATLPPLNVSMAVTGINVDKTALATDIEALLAGYIPGQKLYLSQLTALAIERGAEDCTVSDPAAFPVTPATYQMIRPGTITIS